MKTIRVIALAVLCSLLVVSLSACTEHLRELNNPIPIPLEMKQSTPEEAIRSYLEWLTFAYRNMDSQVASPTMTPDLATRVEYYITMNASQNQLLNQRLDSLEFIESEVVGEVATVVTQESWTFNYLTLDSEQFGEPTVAHYRATYIVLLIDGVWRVQSVNAVETDAHGVLLDDPLVETGDTATEAAQDHGKQPTDDASGN